MKGSDFMSAQYDPTPELIRQQAVLYAQLDRLLDICHECYEDEWPRQRPFLKRLYDEIDKIDRVLEPSEIHIRVVAGRPSIRVTRPQLQQPTYS
jgi:hypothetical protein